MHPRRFVAALGAALVPLLGTGDRAAAQTAGRIVGTVTERTSGAPLPGVQVTLQGTRLGAVSGDNGRYTITGIPAGTYTLEARRVGYSPETRAGVAVAAEERREDFTLQATAVRLQEMIVSGVSEPTSAEKIPLSVSRISKEDLPVPVITTSALIQAKAPGVSVVKGSGTPGGGANIQLRTPTSILKSTSPMFVVDGVVLQESITGTTVDIDALDIESIEVVKGAAAASLYGSRAASGVISITTARGRNLAQGRTQVTARNEYGFNSLAKRIPLNTHHWFATNAQGEFLDAKGAVTPYSTQRVIAADHMADKPYRQTFDNLGAFFNPGVSYTNALSVAQNLGRTNFLASFNRAHETGTVRTLEGYTRNDFRVNLDNALRDNLHVSVSAFHSRSYSDDASGSPFQDLVYYPPDIDLGARGPDGGFIPQPDSTVDTDNPIWRQTSRDNWTKRARTLASADTRWQLFPWFRLSGNYSYDHTEYHNNQYVPKGTPVAGSSDATGSLERLDRGADAINAAGTATLSHQIGQLNGYVTLRTLLERESRLETDVTGSNLIVKDLPSWGVARDKTISNSVREVRSLGHMAGLDLDYAGRYIGSFLVRRDGSSLFGPESRWSTYYRAAGSWRLSEERWYPLPAFVNEFKLRGAIGTAGGRPDFADRYETFNVSSSGAVTKGQLGNRLLRPEFTTEQEYGVDLVAWNRLSTRVTYAQQTTKDQLIGMPVPATSGYQAQTQNAGTVTGRTWELELRGDVYRGKSVNWSMNLVADRNRSKITDWRRTCFFSTTDGLQYRCGGVGIGEMYGYYVLRTPGDLPEVHRSSAGQFQVNDDGYLVPVGPDATWRDGLAKSLWGTKVTIDGVSYDWGIPVTLKTSAGTDSIVRIGNSTPYAHVGYANTIRWKQFSVYGLLDWQDGGNVYNFRKQRLYQYFRSGDVDQAGKAPENKKPLEYYSRLYHGADNMSHFSETASFVKLRELSVRFSPTTGMLRRVGLGRVGAERLALSFVGRNLLTWTRYSGYDPEVGSNAARLEDINTYPNYRTITGLLEIVF